MESTFLNLKNCMNCGTEINGNKTKCPYCGENPDEPPEYTESELGIYD